jgi:hypothetical protein
MELPEEVGLRRAAEILGVDRKTVMSYVNGGLLPWRDVAPPGSTRPLFRVRLDAVMQLRTTYRTCPASGAPRVRKPLKLTA